MTLLAAAAGLSVGRGLVDSTTICSLLRATLTARRGSRRPRALRRKKRSVGWGKVKPSTGCRRCLLRPSKGTHLLAEVPASGGGLAPSTLRCSTPLATGGPRWGRCRTGIATSDVLVGDVNHVNLACGIQRSAPCQEHQSATTAGWPAPVSEMLLGHLWQQQKEGCK
jgi:hypothetical protein